MGWAGGEGCRRPKGNTFSDSPWVCASPQNTRSPCSSLRATVLSLVWAPSPPTWTVQVAPHQSFTACPPFPLRRPRSACKVLSGLVTLLLL